MTTFDRLRSYLNDIIESSNSLTTNKHDNRLLPARMCVSIKMIVYLVVFSAVICVYESAQPFGRQSQQSSSDKLVYPGQLDYPSGVNLPLTQQNHPTDDDYDDELGQQPLGLNAEKKECSQNKTEIPISFIREINDKQYTINDLLLHYVEDYDDIIQSRFGEEEEKAVATMPTNAECMPEYRTISLVQNEDPSVLYIPSCTRIEQCGGCCNSGILECQPIDVELVNYKVLRATYKGGGSNKLTYAGKEIVSLERHKQCKCLCKIKAEDCSTIQEYEERTCKCNCKNTDEEKKCLKENSTKLWNPNTCSCQCRHELLCTTGSEFDTKQCKCVVKQVRRRNVDHQRRYQYRNFALPVIPLREADHL